MVACRVDSIGVVGEHSKAPQVSLPGLNRPHLHSVMAQGHSSKPIGRGSAENFSHKVNRSTYLNQILAFCLGYKWLQLRGCERVD